MASLFSIPIVDAFSTSGITYENRAETIPDGSHPNTTGGEMLGGVITQGLNKLILL